MSKPELYKDKIEVALDGRQIFYLFFGGAVIVGMVFVLGVMVGRRVEARGHVDRAQTEAKTDPLAALDRLDGHGTTYQGALTGAAVDPPSKVEALIANLDKAKPEAAAKPVVEEPKPVVAEPKPVNPKPEAAQAEPKPEAKPKRYTLQLSSFQDKGEADTYLASLKASGYQAYVTEAEVAGKGTFYRVRMGKYGSFDAATDAKTDFEKSAKKSASIMKL